MHTSQEDEEQQDGEFQAKLANAKKDRHKVTFNVEQGTWAADAWSAREKQGR